jgi:hypothetical protein
MPKANSEPSSSTLPVLQIDWRHGSVVMRHGTEVYQGQLPMTQADMSQINTAGGTSVLSKAPSELPPVTEG